METILFIFSCTNVLGIKKIGECNKKDGLQTNQKIESCILQHHTFFILYLCILYPVSCILYPVSCILYPVSCILYPVSCNPYPVSCILYCILYSRIRIRSPFLKLCKEGLCIPYQILELIFKLWTKIKSSSQVLGKVRNYSSCGVL